MMKRQNFPKVIMRMAVFLWIVFTICVTSPILAFSQTDSDSIRVLFIGNSLSAGVPGIVRQMVAENKKKIRIYTSLLSGVQLKGFYDQYLNNTINSNMPSENSLTIYKGIFTDYKFKYVILQGGTFGFLIPEVRSQTFDKVEKLNTAIVKSGAETLLYQNFPSYDFPRQACVHDDRRDMFCMNLENSKTQIDTLRENFRIISERTAARVVFVGEAFEYCHSYYPELQILDTDKSHQSRLGAYLMACLFYKAITKDDWKSTSFETEFGTEVIQKIKYILEEYQK